MYECVSCGQAVHTATFYGQDGTRWVHQDGYEECAIFRTASPNFNKPLKG